LGDELRNKLHNNGIGLLASVNNQNVQLCCVVTDDVKNKYPAGKLVSIAAQYLGGSGGGRPHLATAGAKDISKLPELMQKFADIVIKKI
jgi:alanyl-tRNA synthetase